MKEFDTDSLNKSFSGASAAEIIRSMIQVSDGQICFASSFGAEDQMITHIIATEKLLVRIFTLDTGRLFPETYSLMERTRQKYGLDVQVYFPDAPGVEQMVNQHGVNLFYSSLENRKLCCHIRKVEPLGRALNGMKAWVTGLHRDQSGNRSKVRAVEWDNENQLLKVNPLYNLSHSEIFDYIRANHIPINPLHDKNYLSIGCQPCTRAVAPGEDPRSGRWWWEDGRKECGLHSCDHG